MTTAIVHLLNGDFDTLIASDAKHLGFLPMDLDTTELKPILTKILTEGLLESGSNLKARKKKLLDISNELNEVFFHYPFSVPPFFALITRGLGLLEGIALSGDPDFDIFRASYPYARRRAAEIYGTHSWKMLKRRLSWRLERNRKRLSRYVRAAQVIQNALRVFMAKTMISRLKRNVAATDIQSCYRGLIGRRLYMQKRKELWAAKFVQRAYRGSMGRKKHKILKRAVQAQISLAKKWRGVLSRTMVQKIVERRNSAAVIIQCLWRRSNAKNIAFHRRLRNNSSILIQRIYRGHLGRSKANTERDRYLFSLNQSRGVEIGQQLLIEHKMQASKLQSEVNILNSEKKIVESRVDDVMKEISSFQDTVNDLERSMHQMSLVQATRQSSTEAMHAIREQRM